MIAKTNNVFLIDTPRSQSKVLKDIQKRQSKDIIFNNMGWNYNIV